MARKRAHIEAVGNLTPRDRIWAAIRSLASAGATFTIEDIGRAVFRRVPRGVACSGIVPTTIQTYVEGLTHAGYLELGFPVALPAVYRLARDIGIEAPRVARSGAPMTHDAKRLAMWRAMKIVKVFDRTELRVAASTDAVPIHGHNVKAYVQPLARAGYLQVIRQGRRSRYRFIPSKDTGPRAPQIQRSGRVYDPNLGQVMWHPEANS